MFSDNKSFFMSNLSQSSHLSLGLPLLRLPSTIRASTLLTSARCGLRLTHPNHFNIPSLILEIIDSTSSTILKTPFGIMSSLVLPQVHLSILNSSNSTLFAWAFVTDQHSDSYRIADNGKPMDGLVDDAQKKTEAPPKKIPNKTIICSGRKKDSLKRNVSFSHEMKVVNIVGNKMHKAFPLPVMSSHCQKKFPLLVKKVSPAKEKRCHCWEDFTANEDRAKNSSGNEEGNTASIPTASTQVSPAGPNVTTASISFDTACAYISSQSNGADIYWKKIGKKIFIQGTDVAGFDKSKVECFNCQKMGYIARECRAPRSQDRGRKDNYRQGSKVEEHDLKALMAIDGVG
uniref:CCHC-type domain-containing protein n=1 Tax=Tanacetum cinerariifolium TaxID=118510 RepID=A0A6L2LFE0_TANCI|nr:hypothetical protein [Tanacetum cinerariifolium]